jgi:hypothetical protein
MGCILYELSIGDKAFATDWAAIIYARTPESPSSLSFAPFTSEQSNNTQANEINDLVSSMIQIKVERRCSARELCATINNSLCWGAKVATEATTSTIFLEPSQLLGTEVPIPTCVFPGGYSQIFPPTARYPDFRVLAERRKAIVKSREALYGSHHRLTIWAYLYVAYTQHYLLQNHAALQTLSLALLFNHARDGFDTPSLHTAIMFAFSLVTGSLDAEAGHKMFNQLWIHASTGRIELGPIEKLRLELALLASRANAPDRSCLRNGSVSFALDLITRLKQQENVGSDHMLTMAAKIYLGGLYIDVEEQWDKGRTMVARALAGAVKFLAPDSADLLGAESYRAILDFDDVVDDYGNMLEALKSMFNLLPRVIDCFGTSTDPSTRIIQRIKQGCGTLENLGSEDVETRLVVAAARELISAYEVESVGRY